MYRFIKINFPVTLKENIWVLNPQLKYIQPYKTLHDTDDGGDKSSAIMTCIILYSDPRYENKIYRLEEKSKMDAITAYCEDFKLDDPLVSEIISSYPNDCLTAAARAFKIEEESLTKRTKFIDEAEYTFPEVVKNKDGAIVYVGGRPAMTPGTAKDIDAMRKTTLDIYKKYEMVRKMFEEEMRGEIRIYGGGEETLIDEGGLQLIED